MTNRIAPERVADHVSALAEEIESAIVLDERFLETVLTAVLADGHVLLEDVPGTGKTITAESIATAMGLSFSRIQFTPDLLPADITGSNVYNDHDGSFEFRKGPVFANVLLADEINRAPPKTQSALLEAMQERQVTVDGTTYDLPTPFFVIATQNPVEQEGTFELPEAQLDRFLVKSAIGYPDRDGERELLFRRLDRYASAPSVTQTIDRETAAALRTAPEAVSVDDDLVDYVVDLSRATREDERVDTGVSPRGTQRLLEASRAAAAFRGRDYLVPDDIKRVAEPTLAHRLVLSTEARVNRVAERAVIQDVLDTVDVPRDASAPEA
ncbi:AAA family ATPase [Halorubrum lipolyticum]|uniref:Methanol dehydrogenase regulatory protein n=1 Tax=Halorubrum lipolyticum DSM 21995 TaxID=1227482 RepID=M0NWI9_9EURY|nr:AAA family ATPase [Halorubrum lipolyticum]EMA61923.1 methanol dehydrogenase regulatory protein [Halorubrum lipolyticum DSM 21995]